MKVNDKIKIVYDGVVYICELTKVSNNIEYKVIEKTKSNDDKVLVSIGFSLIKEQKQNIMMQKATELGAFELIPSITKRTIIKLDSKKKKDKIQRWQRICKEASEQSNRFDMPKILDITTIDDLDLEKYDLKIVLSLSKNAQILKKVLQNNTKYDKILLIVGPEGGLAIEEEKYLATKGFILTSLGQNVLRAETAPLVAISMINYELMR